LKVEPGPKLETRIVDFRLEATPDRIRLDEAVNLKIGFRVAGGLRDVFNPDVWDRAIDLDDEHLRVVTTLSILKKVGWFLDRVIVKPIILKRKATFYWTRDPQNPYRVWVMLVDEESNPHIPAGLEDAVKRFFEFRKQVSLLGSGLGRGRHTLYARASVTWTRHFYIEKGRARAASNKVQVEVL
jgi:hypothetical protein